MGQIGVIGGYSRDSFAAGSRSGSAIALVDETDGVNAGIFLAFDLGPVDVRPAIVFRDLPGAVLLGENRTPIDVEIIEIPLDLIIKAPFHGPTPYLVAGPALMFPSSARPQVDDALAGTRIRFDVGIGLEWDLGFRIWPEVRYGQSVGGILVGDTTGDSNLNTWLLQLGVSF